MVFKILVLRLSSRTVFLTLSSFNTPLSSIFRPLICRTRSSISFATISITFSLRASDSVTEMLFRTAFSAHSTFFFLFSAILFTWATMSLTTFSDMVPSISLPPAPTGCAAPILVPGAIAAMSAAMVIMTPAEAALAPLGATYDITGTLLAKIAMTMSRIDSARPPGVSICKMRHATPSAEALSIPFFTKSATAGLMEPDIFRI